MKLKRIHFVSIAAAASLSLTACLNDDNDPAEIRPGFVSFVNAMPDTSGLDFYIQGSQLGNSAIAYLSAYPTSSYLEAQPFDYRLEIAYPDGDQAIFGGQVPIRQDVYVSVYIYNDNEKVEGMALIDDLESPTAGKAKVRFLNLGTDVPDVDLIPEGESAWIQDLEYKDASDDYSEIDPGSYSVQVVDSATDEVLATGSVQLEDSKVYTVWVSGMHEGVGQKALAVQRIEHKEVTASPAP
ncbi:MAG: DUF4397 domain-containing protein [Solitalea sp.]